jgi:NitT/TauT family transport system substrate-binding protein
MTMRIGLMVTLLGGLALTGCKKQPPAAGSAPAEVRLGYFANLTHAQAVLGVDSGELAQSIAPAKLSTKIFNAGPSLVEALFAREIDIGYIGPGPAINAHVRSAGQGVRLIAGASANGVLIVARKDSGIQSLADLKGRTVATPQLANTQDIAARHYLIHVLKQQDAKNVLPLANAEQLGMMKRGQIDASWAVEPWGSLLVSQADARVIAREHELWPDGQVTLAVVITTPKFLAEHPQTVRRVLQVHQRWTARLAQDPQRHVAALGAALYKITGRSLPEGVLPAAISNVRFTDDPLEQTLVTMANWTHELGFARQKPDLAGLVDLTLLNELRRAAPATQP